MSSPERADEARFRQPYACKRARAIELGLQKGVFRVEHLDLRPGAGTVTLGDDAPRFGSGANRFVRSRDGRAARVDVERPLPDLDAEDRIELLETQARGGREIGRAHV